MDVDAYQTVLKVVILELFELLELGVVLDELVSNVLLETVPFEVYVHGEVKFLVNLPQFQGVEVELNSLQMHDQDVGHFTVQILADNVYLLVTPRALEVLNHLSVHLILETLVQVLHVLHLHRGDVKDISHAKL
jgi:hypothetical protein